MKLHWKVTHEKTGVTRVVANDDFISSRALVVPITSQLQAQLKLPSKGSTLSTIFAFSAKITLQGN